MEATKLQMNAGDGENSYAKNSASQRSAMLSTKATVEESVRQVFHSMGVPETLAVADLGCSTGPNAFAAISMILEAIAGAGARQPSEVMMYLNDLPDNDFNGIFKGVPEFRKNDGSGGGPPEYLPISGTRCFFAGVPGSFHDRLFPRNSLHFVYSSSSLHWISQVPPEMVDRRCAPNKGNISLDKTSPLEVFRAYYEQYRKDFTQFLASRSVEVVAGGRMVLLLFGREIREHCAKENPHNPTHYIGKALLDMSQSGLIEEEKADHFNIPLYKAHAEELKEIIEEEGSFRIDKLQEVRWCDSSLVNKGEGHAIPIDRRKMTKQLRAAMETLLSSVFGEDKMDELFRRTEHIIVDEVRPEDFHGIFVLISLVRKEHTNDRM